jgi:hypothetical protein
MPAEGAATPGGTREAEGGTREAGGVTPAGGPLDRTEETTRLEVTRPEGVCEEAGAVFVI